MLGDRLRLRKFLRDNEGNENCSKILNNKDLFEECLDHCSKEFSNEKSGKLLDFLAWLVDHREEILAFIKLLIK